MIRAGLQAHELYGGIKGKGQAYIGRLLDSLMQCSCLEITGDSKYPCIKLSSYGKQVLDSEIRLKIDFHNFSSKPTRTQAKPKTRATASEPSTEFTREDQISDLEQDDLFERLRELRNDIAERRHMRPYQVFPNETLRQLAIRRPVTPAEARQIKGIGEKNSRTILPRFLEEIGKWRDQNKLTTSG